MSDTDAANMTKAHIKSVTGAPDPEEQNAPLVQLEELPIETLRSKRFVWQRPTLKFSMIALLLIPGLAIAAFFSGYGQSKSNPSEQTNLPPATNQPSPASAGEEDQPQTAELQQQNAQLKADAALYKQEAVIQEIETKRQERQRTHRVLPAIATAPIPAKLVSDPPSTSPQLVSRAEPPTVVSAPIPRPEPIRPANDSAQLVSPTDATQEWLRLARLGSYGAMPIAVQPERSTNPEWSADRTPPETPIPTARIASTSAIQASDRTSDTNLVVETEPINAAEVQSGSTLTEAEAAILNAPLELTPTRSLIAGATATGILKTPVVIDEGQVGESSSDRFTVALTQPLLDATGKTALPANTQLVIQVDRLSPQTGRVQVSATTATWQEQGRTQEITLPTGIIQVRGKDGTPLIARQFQDKGKEIAALDAGQFLLGAVRGAAGQFTRSNTSVQSGNGTTVVTEQNQRPNMIAGALQGGTDAILDTLVERNQQAVAEIQQRPPIRFVEAGRPVQIFVNQSMRIPS
jgi:Bacterial conjugation TrbI-like protein